MAPTKPHQTTTNKPPIHTRKEKRKCDLFVHSAKTMMVMMRGYVDSRQPRPGHRKHWCKEWPLVISLLSTPRWMVKWLAHLGHSMPASSHQEARTSQGSFCWVKTRRRGFVAALTSPHRRRNQEKHGPYPFLPTKPGLSSVCNYYECERFVKAMYKTSAHWHFDVKQVQKTNETRSLFTAVPIHYALQRTVSNSGMSQCCGFVGDPPPSVKMAEGENVKEVAGWWWWVDA